MCLCHVCVGACKPSCGGDGEVRELSNLYSSKIEFATNMSAAVSLTPPSAGGEKKMYRSRDCLCVTAGASDVIVCQKLQKVVFGF